MKKLFGKSFTPPAGTMVFLLDSGQAMLNLSGEKK